MTRGRRRDGPVRGWPATRPISPKKAPASSAASSSRHGPSAIGPGAVRRCEAARWARPDPAVAAETIRGARPGACALRDQLRNIASIGRRRSAKGSACRKTGQGGGSARHSGESVIRVTLKLFFCFSATGRRSRSGCARSARRCPKSKSDAHSRSRPRGRPWSRVPGPGRRRD